MNKREVWDAVDADGRLLGFDLYRDEADKIPAGIYHTVVEVVTVTRDGKVLMTQRDPQKPFGLQWEFTGGSAVKGETSEIAAVRELLEETGIVTEPKNLVLMLKLAHTNSLYYVYAHTIDSSDIEISMQEGETVDYRFVPLAELERALNDSTFVWRVNARFQRYKMKFFEYVNSTK